MGEVNGSFVCIVLFHVRAAVWYGKVCDLSPVVGYDVITMCVTAQIRAALALYVDTKIGQL
jgi:hypothetical protein